MKKIFISLIIFSLVLVPYGKVYAQDNLIENNISGGQVTQIILLNCQTEDCLTWIKQYLNQNGGVIAPANNNETNATAVVISDIVNSNSTAPASDVMILGDGNNSTAQNSTQPISVVSVPKGAIRISEIMSAPSSGALEWVELYNVTNAAVDLADWILEEGSGRQTKLSGAIPANGFVVFNKSSLNNDGDIVLLKNSAGDLMDLVVYGNWDDGNVLDNAPAPKSGETIILMNDNSYQETIQPTPGAMNALVTTVVVNTATETTTQTPAVTSATNAAATVTSPTVTIIPAADNDTASTVVNTAANSTTTNSTANNLTISAAFVPQLSDLIRVNEFMPDPIGSDDAEWIELYNSGDQAVNLNGWALDDDPNGGSSPYKIKDNIIIQAKGFLVFGHEETKLVLNNTSDAVVLSDPNNKVVSSFRYDKTKEGVVWAYFDSGWRQADLATPNADNSATGMQIASADVIINEKSGTKQSIATVETPSAPIKTSAAVKSKATAKPKATVQYAFVDNLQTAAIKSKVKISGQVLILPGAFGKQIMYLVGDDDVAMQIYFSKADWPELQLGDSLTVSGTISETQGNRRILVSKNTDISVGDNAELPLPRQIISTDVNDSLGYFVATSGTLVEKHQTKFILADDSGEFTVFLKTGAQIDVSSFTVGDKVNVVGIVNMASDKTLQILPRQQADLVNLTHPQEAAKGKALANQTVLPANNQNRVAVIVLVGVFVVVVLINLWFLLRKRIDLNELWGKIVTKRLG